MSHSASTQSAVRDHAPALHTNPIDPCEPRVDPYPLWRQLRDTAPVYRHPTRPLFILTRFADVFAAARDPARFTSSRGLSIDADDAALLGLPPNLVMMDPPVHTSRRQLIAKAFTPRLSAWMESSVRAFVHAQLDAWPRGDAATVDLVRDLASPLPSFMVAHILGVPQAERVRFDAWSRALIEATADNNLRLERAADSVQELLTFFTTHIQNLRESPGQDLLSALIAAEIDGERLSDWDLLGFCFVVIAGGNDTTTNLICNGMGLLDQHPDQLALLRSEPERLASAIEEMLRYESPVQGLARTTTEAITLHGVTIPADTKVLLHFGSANRDEREFGPDADRFDVTRRARRHLAFSQGPHTCVGAHLARLMARVAFEELLGRYTRFRVDWSRTRRNDTVYARGYEALVMEVR